MRHEPSPAAEPAPITPEMLVDLLKVQAPAGAFLIQGIARDVRPWSGGDRSYVYGRLALGAASVRFRTSPEFAPREDEAVTIKGTLRIDPATRNGEDWRATHQVTLIGNVVGTWEPRAPVEPVLQLPSRDERLPLDEFVSLNGIASLAVLVSGTARADIARTLSEAGVTDRPEFIEANFGDQEKFLSTLHELRNRHDIAGVAIARGGGGGQELIGASREIISELIGMERPFYVALGHATDLALIDKFADQSFHTPSGFGAAIARAIWSAARRRSQERELEEGTKKINELAARIDTMEGNLKRAAFIHRRGVSLSWPVFAIVILIIGGLVWASGLWRELSFLWM